MPPRRIYRRRPKRPYRSKRKKYYKPKRYRKKRVTWSDKMRKTSDALVRLKHKPKNSLRARVRALEGNQSKHFDTLQTALTAAHKINWNGVSIAGAGVTPGNSFPTMLKVTPVLPNGEVQRFSDNFKGTLENERTGRQIFAKSVRLRGCLYGMRPRQLAVDISGTQGPVPPSGVLPVNELMDSDAMFTQDCYTKIWMVILQDMRPSLIKADGSSEPNPISAAGTDESPIESIAQYTAAGISTLDLYGYGQMLKSYESTRFKVKLAKAFVCTAAKPRAEFDVTLDINRELKYEPLAYDDPAPQSGTAPLNYNLLVYFLHNTDPSGPVDYTKLHAPEVKFLTSRLKFLDS